MKESSVMDAVKFAVGITLLFATIVVAGILLAPIEKKTHANFQSSVLRDLGASPEKAAAQENSGLSAHRLADASTAVFSELRSVSGNVPCVIIFDAINKPIRIEFIATPFPPYSPSINDILTALLRTGLVLPSYLPGSYDRSRYLALIRLIRDAQTASQKAVSL